MSDKDHEMTFFQVVASVLRSFLGVQSAVNRERDFTKGKPVHFIAVGLMLTLLFMFAVWGVVQIVMSMVEI